MLFVFCVVVWGVVELVCCRIMFVFCLIRVLVVFVFFVGLNYV